MMADRVASVFDVSFEASREAIDEASSAVEMAAALYRDGEHKKAHSILTAQVFVLSARLMAMQAMVTEQFEFDA